MPSTEAPNWWADVQQEREDLAGPGRRPADDWLGEDIDFVPRRRLAARGDVELRTADTEEHRVGDARHDLHGVFIPASAREDARDRPGVARSMTIELGGDTARPAEDLVVATPADVAHELRHLAAADDPFATPPPPPGTRRTVAIKGRPAAYRLPSQAQRHRGRTTSERVGHRPDRIALWAVVLGAILILVAVTTSSSQAAVPHRATTAPQVHHVTHAAPVVHRHATVRLTRAHR
jgi:hypothetical protein